jgi:uncharacterized Zn finger protein
MSATWTVRSKTQLGVVYVVTRDDAGNFSCSCPDFQYRRHTCKHILKVAMRIAGEKQRNKLLLEAADKKGGKKDVC